MSTSIRVIVADDSAVARRLLTEVFLSEKDFEVVSAAKNGAEAVQAFQKKSADVIVLDVDMPVMDGITAVKEIRKVNRKIPIIMFSSLTAKGGETTLSALEAGATDFVTKPTVVGHLSEAMDYIRSELVFRVRLHCQPETETPAGSTMEIAKQPAEAKTSKPEATAARTTPNSPIELVVMGSSTGGPNALTEVLKQFPADFPVPILLVQHMPPVFTKLLAERLDKICKLSVEEATDGQFCEAGKILIAPGGYHLLVEMKAGRPFVKLDEGETENSCRPAVDVLFRSAAKHYRKRTLGVILTGMGQDGLEGCRTLYQAGARILVQDEETSVVWGMPKAVTDAGLADDVLPLDEIGLKMSSIAKHHQRSLAAS